jgi:glycine C-acetyltransferase/8-amino-7-oxononanoate synthase
VPDGTSRLRLAVMATHTKDELRVAARVLGRAALQAGLRPATVAAPPVAGADEGAREDAATQDRARHGAPAPVPAARAGAA